MKPVTKNRHSPQPTTLNWLIAVAMVAATIPALATARADSRDAVRRLTELGAEIESDEQGQVVQVGFRQTSADDSALAQLSSFSKLARLDLTGTKVTDRGLSSLTKLVGLEVLELDGTNIGDEGLKVISGFPKLSFLSLSGTNVTDAGLVNLRKLPELKSLQLRRRPTESFSIKMIDGGLRPVPNIPPDHKAETRITAGGAKQLTALVCLESLDLAGAALDDDLSFLSPLVKLTSLSLENAPVTDAALVHLAPLVKLESLNLSGTKITDASLAVIARFGELETLSLSDTRVSNAGLAQLVGLKKLHSLWLQRTKVDRAGMEKLMAVLRSLQNVDYPGKPSSDGTPDVPRFAEIEEIGGTVRALPNVQVGPAWVVDFEGKPIGDADLKRLQVIDDAAYGYLTMVILAGTKITDAAFDELAKHPTIEWIDVRNTGITGAGLSRLKPLPRLKCLILTGAKIDGAAFAALAELPTLESLNVADTAVSDLDLGRLRALEQLRILNLSETKITDAGAKHLAQLSRLEGLDLSKTKVTDAAGVELAKIANLTSLEANGTTLSGESLVALTNLQWLSLKDAKLSAAGLDTIGSLSKLSHLMLNDVKIEGSLPDSFEKLSQLQVLELDRTGLKSSGLKPLARLPQLKKLTLHGNDLTGSGLAALKGAAGPLFLDVRESRLDTATYTEIGKLGQLKALVLDKTDTNDADLAALGELKIFALSLVETKLTAACSTTLSRFGNLQFLDLSGVPIGDETVQDLSSLRNLRQLNLTATRLTTEGLKRVQAALPRCRVHGGDPPAATDN